ncbi:hypothetical protein [Streptomyces sp. NPDC051572]|uniref:hypothetical protein n=1 Tax=Streptomyces sp. NPDC051572 TaxID=3155802 RepID=UPI00344BA4E6
MAIELAIALGALVARTAVAQLVAGQAMDNAAWAGAASQVVDVLVSTATRQESGLQQLGQGFEVLGRKIDAVGKQVGDIPGREFEEYMAAGRRYVRDLPDTWRSARDRRGLIQDARREFVHAYGIAEHMRSPHRQALADVAIAGCWLWVPSLPDVRKTIGAARQILETELLRGSTLPTKSYADVLYLCRSYGEQPRTAVDPILPAPGQAPTPFARLAVRAPYGRWVTCAGIDVRIDALTDAVEEPTPSGLVIPSTALEKIAPALRRGVRVQVRNNRADWIALRLSSHAVLANLPTTANTLQATNRVRPGTTETLDLTAPPTLTSTYQFGNPLIANPLLTAIPKAPVIGFVLD